MKTKIFLFTLSVAAAMILTGCTSSPGDSGYQKSDGTPITPVANSSTKATITITNPNLNQQTASKSGSSDSTTNPQLAGPKPGDKVAILVTDMGTIRFKLFTEQTPETAKNFEKLANAGKYNKVPFHRVVKNFMIQTGDFTNKNGTGGYSYKGPGTYIDNETLPSIQHLYGTVSMANAGPNTNGSQFFIVTNKAGTSFLDGSYSAFGQVYEGQDVADKIAALEVPGTEKPSKAVNIISARVESFKK